MKKQLNKLSELNTLQAKKRLYLQHYGLNKSLQSNA